MQFVSCSYAQGGIAVLVSGVQLSVDGRNACRGWRYQRMLSVGDVSMLEAGLFQHLHRETLYLEEFVILAPETAEKGAIEIAVGVLTTCI